MKRRLSHWLMNYPWLCSKHLHGRVPFGPWCLYAWAVEECGRNHPEDWEEVETTVSPRFIVDRPARVVGANIYFSGAITTSTAAMSHIKNARIRGPVT